MSAPKVLVTGGGRGIGRAIALRFAREGAMVAVASRTSAEIDEVAAEIEAAGGKGLAAQMNVRDFGSVEAAVYRAIEWADGTLDVLVNNAGIFGVAPFEKLKLDDFHRMLEVNLAGPVLVTSEAMEGLEASERAHIFNVASTAGKQGFPGGTAYCASKYGLRGFSDALREDLRAQNIRVSTVYPGATDTTIFDDVPGDWDRAAMNRPEDVAEVIWNAWSAGPDTNVDDLDVPPPA